MGQIEELPDDFHEALDLHSPPAAKKPARSGQGTGLRDIAKDGGKPASAASEKPKTADEILKMMSETPLFMTNLDDAADAGTQPSLVNIEVWAECDEQRRTLAWRPCVLSNTKAPEERSP